MFIFLFMDLSPLREVISAGSHLNRVPPKMELTHCLWSPLRPSQGPAAAHCICVTEGHPW